MEIVAQCIENMLITSISHEYGVQKKKYTTPEKHKSRFSPCIQKF
jgi:hypothetical protein